MGFQATDEATRAHRRRGGRASPQQQDAGAGGGTAAVRGARSGACAGGPAPEAQAAPVPPPADPADQLEHLAQLHASGVLTDEEFATAKANVLAG